MKLFWSVTLALLGVLAMVANNDVSAQQEKVMEKVVETKGGKSILKYVELAAGKGKGQGV